uniref:Fatty acyl-CoA reductase n=1 Tax=Spodoptera frugiperda TaxID=7108 RepID=A0A2H1V8I9_SPOFR
MYTHSSTFVLKVPCNRGRAYCHILDTIPDSVLLPRNFSKIRKNPSNTLLDPGIEPETPCSAVALATTRPMTQYRYALGSHFGTYAFAKALSEAYIVKNHGKVPTVIIRPSAVTATKDGPVKGWLDNWFGASGILYYINEGVIRVLHGHGNHTVDFIPVDYVSNLCIISALRAKESNEVQVYNSTSTSDNPVNWDTIFNIMKEEKTLSGKNKFPYLSMTYVDSKLALQLGTFFLQITPAVLADLWLKIKGKDPKYLKVVTQALTIRNAYDYFTTNNFILRSDRTRGLYSSLSPEDREEFPCDPTQIRWPEYLKDNMNGIYKLADPANFIQPQIFFSHLSNLPWTSTNNSRPKLAKSVHPFTSFSETNEQQLIFIYRDNERET